MKKMTKAQLAKSVEKAILRREEEETVANILKSYEYDMEALIIRVCEELEDDGDIHFRVYEDNDGDLFAKTDIETKKKWYGIEYEYNIKWRHIENIKDFTDLVYELEKGAIETMEDFGFDTDN